MLHSDFLWLGAGFVIGTVVGSFLNVLIARVPHMVLADPPEKNLWTPRSHCPHCRHTLRLRHLIPIFSYLVLRGRCAYCQVRISPRYPLLELTGGLLAVGALMAANNLIEAAAYAVLTWGLLALAWIDWQTQLLPDLLVYPLLWLGLLANAYGLFAPLQEAVLGAVAGYASLWLLHQLFMLARKTPGMGYGDFKLFAVCGAWLGWILLPWVALCAAGLTLLLGLARARAVPAARTLPFGPALALTLAGFLLWRDTLILTLHGLGP